MTWDAVVIGAGPNGLTAAAYLARAGRRVLLLEAREAEDPVPHAGWIPPAVIRELGLARHGLRVAWTDPWVAAPLPAGGRLALSTDVGRSCEAIGHVSAADAARWPAFCERMARLARFLERLYDAAPPRPTGKRLRDLAALAALGRRFRGLGKTGMIDLLRTLPMSVAELLDDWFESDTLKGALGAAGVLGIRQGPRSGGTAFLLLHHHVGCPPGVFRPPVATGPDGAGLERVLADAARHAGVAIRRGAPVAHILAPRGAVAGVALADGEELATPCVVSSADPRRTLLDLVDPDLLEPEFVRAVTHIKYRGAAARVVLTLDRPLDITMLSVSPDLAYLERAYDATKYGRVSERPWVEARALEPPSDGQHRVLVHVQYAPYALADGVWDTARRDALGALAVATLAPHVPGLDEAIVRREIFTPRDLEAVYGATEGNLSHGELTLDQILFMRPVPGWAHYRMPVAGLYLCGAGTHPGGIAGASGRLAAQAVLADRARL